MKIPEKGLEDFCLDLIDRCRASRPDRSRNYNALKQYYFAGSATGTPSKYNMCLSHIDRLSSYLFSPSDVNFRVHFALGESIKNVPKDWSNIFTEMFKAKKQKPQELKYNDWPEMGRLGASYLNYEFGRTAVDTKISSALDWALIKGTSFVNVLWGPNGFEPYVWQPEMMGVLREDITGLDRQEAFTATSYITMNQFKQKIKFARNKDDLMKKVRKKARNIGVQERFTNDFLHQIVVGGTATSSNPNGNLKASAQIFGMPTPKLSPKTMQDLLICHEIWIQDDDRDDWTTIQLIEPDIIIEGKLQRRNLSGIKGETSFKQICPNPVEGYFWGNPELNPLLGLQDQMNIRIAQVNRVLKKRTRPSWAMSGFSGDTDNIKSAMDSADGILLAEQGPSSKVDKMQPDGPEDLVADIKRIKETFDDVAGFAPIVRGEGESGVRSGAHAETLVRTASPRMRDKAILVEKEVSTIGDYCFKLLQAKTAKSFTTRAGDEFLLAQLPEDVRVYVDSHSASPAFSEDGRNLAYQLAKLGAIDHVSLLELVHPANEEVLVQRARDKQESEAKLIQEHPEVLLGKGKGKSHH